MKLKTLDLIVTEDCNFDCSYCYQEKDGKYMEPSTVEKAIAYFHPFFEEKAHITFFGGEPLLAFDTIKHTVSLVQEKNRNAGKDIQYSITTNGSLFTDEIFRFLADHGFFVLLSYDGLIQDETRKPGSRVPTLEVLRVLQSGRYPGIKFATNSVFSPATVNRLSESLISIIREGVANTNLSLTQNVPWDEAALKTLEEELDRLKSFLAVLYKEKKIAPVSYFQPAGRETSPPAGEYFTCNGGYDRIAVSPDEDVWGCGKFHFYLKEKRDSGEFSTYSFGALDNFIENFDTVHPRVLANYNMLSQDCYFTEKQFCFLCEEVENCQFCPVTFAFATSLIGKIPPWACRIEGILRKVRRRFLMEIEGIQSVREV